MSKAPIRYNTDMINIVNISWYIRYIDPPLVSTPVQLSIATSTVTSQWNQAYIWPVPKITGLV